MNILVIIVFILFIVMQYFILFHSTGTQGLWPALTNSCLDIRDAANLSSATTSSIAILFTVWNIALQKRAQQEDQIKQKLSKIYDFVEKKLDNHGKSRIYTSENNVNKKLIYETIVEKLKIDLDNDATINCYNFFDKLGEGYYWQEIHHPEQFHAITMNLSLLLDYLSKNIIKESSISEIIQTIDHSITNSEKILIVLDFKFHSQKPKTIEFVEKYFIHTNIDQYLKKSFR